ncbi:MAG: hypothetical protein U0610_00700 [bacterium]
MGSIAFMALPILACAALARHSLRVRGREATLLFFLCAIVFSVIRGLVDAQRPLAEVAQVSHLDLWLHEGRDFGLFMIMMPAVRAMIAYVGLLAGERFCARRGGSGGGALRMCSIALLTYSLLGVLVECGGEALGWWTYRPTPEVNPSLLYHFLKGMNWGGGIVQAFFVAKLDTDRFERPVVVALNYMFGYFLVLTVCTLVNPGLRTILFAPFNLGIIVAGFFKQGPRLTPLRLPVGSPTTSNPVV